MRPPSNQSIPCGKISLSVGDQIIIKILGLLTVILTSPSWAQDLIIPTVSATVQEFININGTDMSLLTASCETFDACRDMNYHSKTYTFKGNAQSDQKKYRKALPVLKWNMILNPIFSWEKIRSYRKFGWDRFSFLN